MVLVAITGELGCHSEDTLVLTPNGIKNYKELKIGDEVLAVDQDFNIVKTRIKQIYEYPYDGVLFNFKSKRYDFLVTPNHRMLFKKVWRKKFEWLTADEVNSEGYFPSSFNWNGKNQDLFNIYDFVPNKENLHEFNTDNFLKLVGWYISEGCLFKNSKNKINYVEIRNYKYVDEIKNLLKELNLKFGFYENSKFVIFHRDLARYLERCGTNAYNKRIPPEILELSRNHLKNLFETLWKGDGSSNHTYYTTSKNLFHDFIILCLKLGYGVRYTIRKKGRIHIISNRKIKAKKDCYEIHVSFRPKNWFSPYPDKSWKGHKNLELVKYKGKVWCFETEHGNFFTVRNGKICLSGNSGKTLLLSYLVWNNFYFKKREIATNYTIYGIPFYRITTINQFFKFIPEKESEEEILEGKEKAFFGDDFWRFISSRMVGMGARQKNEVINRILMASRKAFVTVYYTTQLFSMIDKNIRDITELLFKPTLSGNFTYCKGYTYGIIEGKLLQPLQPIYFWTEPIFAIYSTFERAGSIELEGTDELVLEYHPIDENPAWKRYCMINLGINPNSEEYYEKCREVEEGLGLSDVRKKFEKKI